MGLAWLTRCVPANKICMKYVKIILDSLFFYAAITSPVWFIVWAIVDFESLLTFCLGIALYGILIGIPLYVAYLVLRSIVTTVIGWNRTVVKRWKS